MTDVARIGEHVFPRATTINYHSSSTAEQIPIQEQIRHPLYGNVSNGAPHSHDLMLVQLQYPSTKQWLC